MKPFVRTFEFWGHFAIPIVPIDDIVARTNNQFNFVKFEISKEYHDICDSFKDITLQERFISIDEKMSVDNGLHY